MKQKITCVYCGFVFEGDPEDGNDLCECPRCVEREASSAAEFEKDNQMTKQETLQKRLLELSHKVADSGYGKANDIDIDALRDDLEELTCDMEMD